MFQRRKILLGVTGGIAAYKAADLTSYLRKAGAQVQVIMTPAATRFISALTLAGLSGRPVYHDLFDEDGGVRHVELAEEAEVVVVAPASANTLAKLALGLADNLLSTVLLAVRAPVLVAPAMNVNMFAHPAVRHNLETLRSRGVVVVEPDSGVLACGSVGQGRLAGLERIVAALAAALETRRDFAGLRVLVTAGPTREDIDPVRFITNRSSGKMGFAVAAAASRRGAEVTLVYGPGGVEPPPGVKAVAVESAREMYDAVLAAFPASDVVIKAAAVADYRPVTRSEHKIKKSEANLVLELTRNPDILAELGRRKEEQVLVGFAAETEGLLAHAGHKLKSKNLDLIVANDVSRTDSGFAGDANMVSLLFADGNVETWPLLPKTEVADRILDAVAGLAKSRLKEQKE